LTTSNDISAKRSQTSPIFQLAMSMSQRQTCYT